jgi:hypothetical protein
LRRWRSHRLEYTVLARKVNVAMRRWRVVGHEVRRYVGVHGLTVKELYRLGRNLPRHRRGDGNGNGHSGGKWLFLTWNHRHGV